MEKTGGRGKEKEGEKEREFSLKKHTRITVMCSGVGRMQNRGREKEILEGKDVVGRGKGNLEERGNREGENVLKGTMHKDIIWERRDFFDEN